MRASAPSVAVSYRIAIQSEGIPSNSVIAIRHRRREYAPRSKHHVMSRGSAGVVNAQGEDDIFVGTTCSSDIVDQDLARFT